MKIINPAALILLSLVSALCLSAPELHDPPIIQAPPVAEPPSITLAPRHLGRLKDARGKVAMHHPPGTSPTNGRRSVATTISAADTHRDPVRHEAADSINSAKAIALNVGSRKEVDISSVKRDAGDKLDMAMAVVLVGAATYGIGYMIYAVATDKSPPKHPKNRRSNCVEEANFSNKHSGAVQANRRRSSAPAPGDRNTLLYPMQIRYDEHFDSEDAIRMVMRPHSKAEDKKNAKSEPHAPQGRRDVDTQRLGSAL